jgi:hypothetical protein
MRFAMHVRLVLHTKIAHTIKGLLSFTRYWYIWAFRLFIPGAYLVIHLEAITSPTINDPFIDLAICPNSNPREKLLQ